MYVALNTLHSETTEHLGGVVEYVAQFVISAARSVSITTTGIADLILSAKLVCTN